jgi:hypothetical protein
MPSPMPDSLQRLRAVNPARVDPTAAQSAPARATLERILAEPRTTRGPGRLTRWMKPRRATAVAVAAIVLGGGAVAAADPFGWWSADQNTARYAVAFQTTTTGPSAPRLVCDGSGSQPACAPAAASGRAYVRMGTVQPVPADRLSAASLRAEIARRVAAGQLSAADADAARSAVATTPAAAFAEARQALAFGSLTANVTGPGGKVIVPPAGVPEFLACSDAGGQLACRDLNGDTAVPVGAAIYRADPTGDWRADPDAPRGPSGRPLSPQATRLLGVLLQLSTS